MFKLKLILASISLTSIPALTTINAISQDDQYSELSAIEQNIESNSRFLRNETTYLYNNQEYRNKDEIISKYLKTDPIDEISTSSNPNKIIIDQSTGRIDENKVYSSDRSDFVKLYKNIYGKTVLPSCNEVDNIEGCINSDKTAKDRSLNSYVSPGNVRIKYSYDLLHWNDSTEEAMNDYKRYGKFSDPQLSLFYSYKGLNYNAFNNQDFESMKANMKPAFYYSPIDEDVNPDYELSKPFTASRDNFVDVYENKLEKDIKNYFANVNKNDNVKNLYAINNLDYELTFKIDYAGQWFELSGDVPNNSDLNISTNKNDGTITFNFKNQQSAESLDLEAIKKKFLNRNQWVYHLHKKGIDELNDYYTNDFNLKGHKFTITATTTGRTGKGKNETRIETIKEFNNSFNSNEWIVNENLDSNISFILNAFYWNEIKHKLNSDSFYNDLVYKTWNGLSISFKSNFFKFLKNFISDNITKDILSSIFQKDYMYTDDSSFSVIQSQKNFENLINDEYCQYKDNEEFSIKELNSNIQLTKKQWLTNFHYLDDANDVSILPLDEMWFIGDENDNLFTFSDKTGRNIAQTIDEAKNIRIKKENPLLYKQYLLYDPNGNLLATTFDEDQEFTQLKNQIVLDYSYVSRQELKILKNNESDFSDIISDGLYNVYRFKNSNNDYVYYDNYLDALNMYLNKTDLITGVKEVNKDYYKYVTILNDQIKEFVWSTKEDIANIARQIYNEQ